MLKVPMRARITIVPVLALLIVACGGGGEPTVTERPSTALETAEITGTESESLTHLSEDYQRRAETATLALAVAASLAIWGLVAVLIIYVIFRLFFTLYLDPIHEALEMMQ